MRTFLKLFAASFLAAAVTACAGWNRQERDTAVGAGVGAAAGNVVTGGSAVGTVGGAAVGGYIGHEYGKRNP
jgi:osmotically inducible lipoprotein OsmB